MKFLDFFLPNSGENNRPSRYNPITEFEVLRDMQPQDSFMWNMRIVGPNTEDPKTGHTGNTMQLHVRQVAIPEHTQTPITRKYCGVEYDYAGTDNSPKTIRVSFWDNNSFDAYHFMTRWYRLGQDETFSRSLSPADYKREVIIDMLDRQGSRINERFFFYGAFPIEVSEISLNYEESSPVTFDATIKFSHRDKGIVR